MITIAIPLQYIVLDVAADVDVSSLPIEELIERIRAQYAFLGDIAVTVHDDTVLITLEQPDATQRAGKLMHRALNAAQKGRYPQAINLFKQVIELTPEDAAAHRNLGMAYLEQGDIDSAETYLIQALSLDPQDAWSHVLLGNVYLQARNNLELAAVCYERALAIDPDDANTLSNYAALLSKQGDSDEARRYYRRAIAADPAYPNSYYNFAVLEQDNPDVAIEVLDLLFEQPVSDDIRAQPVYDNARRLYERLCVTVAREQYDELMGHIDQRRSQLEAAGGIEIEIVPDQKIATTAKAEIMWHQYGRRSHIVRYKIIHPAMTPHLIAHELEHIALETAAREAGKNKFFTTNDETARRARRDIKNDIDKLIRSGRLPQQMADGFANQIISGMANQLFNAPLDMFIEWRLWQEQPAIRASQIASLAHTVREGVPVITDPDVKRRTPRLIYRANAAYAFFVDTLTKGRTNLSDPYAHSQFARTGQQLLGMWQEANADYQHGDEYLLVDQFAAVLRLTYWFDWQDDQPRPAEEVGGSTNLELLREKYPAAVMYCLSALQRFDKLTRDEIRQIVTEIAVLGQSGLDYADSTQKYTLRTVPGEQFSGLQMMCLMYVGFKDINPTVDPGMDLQEPYETALTLHQGNRN